MREQDKLRYKNECNQLRTQGFFINEHGINSTQLKVKMTREQIKLRCQKKLAERAKESARRIKELEKRVKVKERDQQQRLRERKAQLKIKERDQREKEKQKAIQAKEKQKEIQTKQKNEEFAWHTFYCSKFRAAFDNDKISAKRDRKKNVDEALKQQWFGLSLNSKRKYLKKSVQIKQEQTEQIKVKTESP